MSAIALSSAEPAAIRGTYHTCAQLLESGAKLARPELFRLLSDARPGDILLVEQVDRLSRLNAADWEHLKGELAARRVRAVVLDLPTSWVMAITKADEFTARMFDAINGMMLYVLAAVARKVYEDRRSIQAQGQEKAKAAGLYVCVSHLRPEQKLQQARGGYSGTTHTPRSAKLTRTSRPGRRGVLAP